MATPSGSGRPPQALGLSVGAATLLAVSSGSTVRSQRELSRSGLWATGPVQLELPLTAPGLSELVRANGRLKTTPDFDVFAWLCERWIQWPDGAGKLDELGGGWVHFTLGELGRALYDKKPPTKERRALRASIRRLRSVQVDIVGYDGSTGAYDQRKVTNVNLINAIVSELDNVGADARKVGALRGSTFKVQLAPWLCKQLLEGNVARVNWPTLRSFGERQLLAKRLYVYLCAERWKLGGADREGTWVAVGDRFYTALGMDYERHRDARAALTRAAKTVLAADERLLDLEIVRVGAGHQLRAHRMTAAAFKEHQKRRREVRAEIQASLASAA